MESKEILDLIGFEGDPTTDSLKEHMGKTFISRVNLREDEDFKNAIGRLTGSISTKIKAFLKKDGIEVTGDTPEALFEAGLKAYNEKIEGLKSTDPGKESKKITELEKDLQKKKDEYSLLVDQHKNLETQLETANGEKEAIHKEYKVKELQSRAWGKVPWKKDMTPVEKAGFESIISSKYKTQLGENGLEILHDGKPVQNETKTKNLSFEEVLNIEGKAFNLIGTAGGGSGEGNPARKREPEKQLRTVAKQVTLSNT